MKTFTIFLLNLARKCHEDQIMERAAGLTYRVLLAFFPFLIFLMSLFGFTQFDSTALLAPVYQVLPGDAGPLVEDFVQGLEQTRSGGLMSTALFFSVYNSANGFRAIIRNSSSAFDFHNPRNGVKQVALSLVMMVLFASVLLVMLVLLVLGRYIWELFMPAGLEMLFTPLSAIGAFLVMAFATMMIFKLAAPKKLRLLQVLPGAIITVVGWAVASAVFGFVMINFTQYPAIYGSIAGVFILILWLNLISVILLIGNELNALLVTERKLTK
ncbi:MAG: YihY/virulence factor BrkB family protein [Defluviitaleaceae bacterium]|nr:YihY/virulence factor BrkB family protein [Defluviitaleaceae bacterium]